MAIHIYARTLSREQDEGARLVNLPFLCWHTVYILRMVLHCARRSAAFRWHTTRATPPVLDTTRSSSTSWLHEYRGQPPDMNAYLQNMLEAQGLDCRRQ